MASQINPLLIDPTYPIAGVNNNTSGFRDNFAAIQQNFVDAQREINDIMNKAVVTAPLTYGPTSVGNNLNGQILSGPVLNDFSYAINAHGTITATGIEPFNFTSGYWHTITLNGNGATTSILPSNVPSAGYAQLQIQVTVLNSTHNFSLSSLGTINTLVTPGFNAASKSIQFNQTGTYLITLGTVDGASWDVTVSYYTVPILHYTPPAQTGSAGDTAGMIAYDANFLYICTANFDGSSNIWFRTALSW